MFLWTRGPARRGVFQAPASTGAHGTAVTLPLTVPVSTWPPPGKWYAAQAAVTNTSRASRNAFIRRPNAARWPEVTPERSAYSGIDTPLFRGGQAVRQRTLDPRPKVRILPPEPP